MNLDIIEGANRILTDLSSALQNSVELRVAKGETVARVYVDNKPVGTSVTFKYFWIALIYCLLRIRERIKEDD